MKISSRKKNLHNITYSRKCKLKSVIRTTTRGSRKQILTEDPAQHLVEKLDFVSPKRRSSGKLLNDECRVTNHNGNVDGSDDGEKRKQKRRRYKRRKENVVQDEMSRFQNRTRYLLIKIKLEQSLIDAYSGEGWKGKSREKIKPKKELERARRQIVKCKLGIRDVIQHVDKLSREGRIDDSMMLADGSVFHEHIFCAICKSCEASQDNDIILCDGACNRAFHQKCLEPPLMKIPPGDQGWLCKLCVCKMEIVDSVNAHLGTGFSVNSNWEDVFQEAVTAPVSENNYLDPDLEWPSEDSADADYDPEASDEVYTRETKEYGDEAGSYSISSRSSDLDGFLSGFSPYSGARSSQFTPKRKDRCLLLDSNSLDSDNSSIPEFKTYQRKRRDVDYKKLYDEMFGKELIENDQQSEDEDWGPNRRKRKGTKSDSDAATTSKFEKDACLESPQDAQEKSDSFLQYRKILFRIPPDALEKLRQVFAENELPSRAVKDKLSKQLGIAVDKVSRWFKNARYAALRARKEECSKNSGHATRQSPFFNFKNIRKLKDHTTSVAGSNRNEMLLEEGSNKENMSLKPKKPRVAKRLPSNMVESKMKSSRSRASLVRKSIIVKRRTASRTGHSGAYNQNEYDFAELERLCNLEDRLEKLKKALKECGDQSDVSDINISGPLVVHVPVIEIKEKEAKMITENEAMILMVTVPNSLSFDA